ncbi:MAG TPA: hypothetical protein VN437_02240, partial [Rectinemataceae bacterium]|nr:hypothetical protein [Rectinemataceae bacterium]
GLGVFDVLSRLASDGKTKGSASASPFLIKWPNDVMGLDQNSQGSYRKLCGILCEMSKGWLLAGIGINLRKTAYPDSLKDSATSLEEVLDERNAPPGLPMIESESLAQKIAEAILLRIGDAGWKDDYQKHMWMLEKDVSFIVGHPIQGNREHGTVLGIDDTGRLLLRKEGGEINAFFSGEISNVRDL